MDALASIKALEYIYNWNFPSNNAFDRLFIIPTIPLPLWSMLLGLQGYMAVDVRMKV
jgi:hypothetical protein